MNPALRALAEGYARVLNRKIAANERATIAAVRRTVRITDITVDELKATLSYNPETGEFRYRRTGRVCRAVNWRGYTVVKIGGHQYRLHRLAWLYVHGAWPDGDIDHKNRIKTDNRIANLRIATPGQNNVNRGRSPLNKTGFKGVHAYKNRFYARVQKNRLIVFSEGFDTAEEANAAYCREAKKHHGDFAYLETHAAGPDALRTVGPAAPSLASGNAGEDRGNRMTLLPARPL